MRPEYYPARILEVLPGQPYLSTVSMVREACRDPEINFRYITDTSRKVFDFEGVVISPHANFSACANCSRLLVSMWALTASCSWQMLANCQNLKLHTRSHIFSRIQRVGVFEIAGSSRFLTVKSHTLAYNSLHPEQM